MGGVVCFADDSNAVASAVITIAPGSGALPSRWGLQLPGHGGYSQDNGQLITLNTNYMNIPSPLQVTNLSTITTPTMGPSLNSYLGVWNILLPIAV